MYHEGSPEYEDGKVVFTIRQESENLRCALFHWNCPFPA